MKKFAALFALLGLIAFLPACGGKSTKKSKESKLHSAKTEEVKKEATKSDCKPCSSKRTVEYGKEDFVI